MACQNRGTSLWWSRIGAVATDMLSIVGIHSLASFGNALTCQSQKRTRHVLQPIITLVNALIFCKMRAVCVVIFYKMRAVCVFIFYKMRAVCVFMFYEVAPHSILHTAQDDDLKIFWSGIVFYILSYKAEICYRCSANLFCLYWIRIEFSSFILSKMAFVILNDD